MYNVIKSVGLNEDGINLIKKSDKLKGMKVEDAVTYLIDEAKKEGYIKDNEENYLVVAYTGKKDKEDIQLEEKIKDKAESSGMVSTIMNVEKNRYDEMKKNLENPAVEGLKEKLIERNVPEQDIEDIEEVKELARMLKNTEKEQNANGQPEGVGPDKETGPPEHADPQGKDKEDQDTEDKGSSNEESEKNDDNENDNENKNDKENENGNSKKPGNGSKGNGGHNW